MMHIFLNGMGASAGGGLTYLRNVLPHLSRMQNVRTTALVSPEFKAGSECRENVELLRLPFPGGSARRFWFEQTALPKVIRRCQADILISAGNFALRRSPVPQILLSRNSLYTSADFSRDIIRRGEYRMWLDTRLKGALAKKSIHWAGCTVAPSEAFAGDLQRWSGKPVRAIHHGFDHELFFASRDPLPEEIRQKLECPTRTLRILLVSHYNYYRNIETVLRAIAVLAGEPGAPPVRLFLTCDLRKEKTPGAYDPQSAARLIDELGIREQVVELGSVPYEHLHHVYKFCDLFVTAAYTETFAHPVVEAMASGLPVIASDLPVHREICGDAAAYFSRFSADELVAQLSRLAAKPDERRLMASSGLDRSHLYSWEIHVAQLLTLAQELLGEVSHRQPQSRAVSAA
ncbi:MAG TPA: glycosyltransferase family 1 protein [Terriglobales bacterium]|jgi:glycosyltransferase involved in cell wall biosynthesis